MVDFADTPEQAAFRTDVEAFIEEHLPDSLKSSGGMGGLYALFEGGGDSDGDASPMERMGRIFATMKP